MKRNCGLFGSMTTLVKWGVVAGPIAAFGSVLEIAITPLKTADQAARFVWFTERSPRAALSFGATVKLSRTRQSLVGWVSTTPAQRSQASGRGTPDFR